jgi:glycosyltransferase involved in cell wall biosynthesis
MRIVFINPIGRIGGAERSLLAWMKAAGRAYPAARLCLIVPSDESLASRAREIGVEIEVIPMPASVARLGGGTLRGSRVAAAGRLLGGMMIALPGAIAYARRVRAALRRLEPGLIHSNGLKCHLLLRLIAPAGVPIVWHIHDFIGQRPRMAGALRWASSAASAGVAVSRAVEADARGVLAELPLHVVYNVTDMGEADAGREAGDAGTRPAVGTVEPGRGDAEKVGRGVGDGAALDGLAGLAAAGRGTVRVVLVATYARWKGQGVFLQAAARAMKSPGAPPMRFYIVGGPIYHTGGSQFTEAELRAMAAELGVGGIVGFIGFQNDPAGIYRSADVVVHASTEPDPFGLTVIEAMACGRATIAVKAGGSAELFTDGRDAVGIMPNDPAALAEAILTLAASEDSRMRLGMAARETVARRFNPDNLPARIREVYETLLNREAAAST